MGKAKTHSEFLIDLERKNPNIIILGEYHGSSIPIQCRCPDCGLVWESRPNNLLHGYGCPDCGIKKRAETRSKDPSTFLDQIANINPNIEVLEAYQGARTPIKCSCKNCGHTWKAAPTNLLRGRKCPKCSRSIAAGKLRKSHAEFLEIVHGFHPDIEPLEEYQNYTTKIKMKCNICGHEWSAIGSALIRGSGCPGCAGNKIYSTTEFKEKLQIVNPSLEILGEYKRSIIPIKCRCSRCGNVWETRPNNLLNGTGCPACFHSTTSFIEQTILLTFQSILGEDKVESQNTNLIGKELDIYIPSLSLAIEPGSWKWHKNKLNSDYEKRCMCSSVGVRLITIYSDYLESEPPFETDCICVGETLGYENEEDALINLITKLLALANLSFSFQEQEWNKIKQTAYAKSRRLTTEEFAEKIKAIHPSIVITGEYTGAWNKIAVKCLLCGHHWMPAANSLVQNHGCPKCADRIKGESKRKNAEEFKLEISKVNDNIILMGEYRLSQEKVPCKCRICGYEWQALPGNLLKGKGCPHCGKKSSSQKRRKSSEQFLAELSIVNPTIQIISSYSTYNELVECNCLICGNKWSAQPANILRGRSCPVCAKERRKQSQKQKLLSKSGSLLEINPSLAKEWHPSKNTALTPAQVTPGSGKKAWWLCPDCGHEWAAVIGSRNKGHNCPKCAKKK